MIFPKILIKWYNKCLSFSLLLDISSEWRIQSRIWNVYAPLRMFEALHNFLIFFTSTYSCIFINVCNIPQLECDHKDINNYNFIFVGVWTLEWRLPAHYSQTPKGFSSLPAQRFSAPRKISSHGMAGHLLWVSQLLTLRYYWILLNTSRDRIVFSHFDLPLSIFNN